MTSNYRLIDSDAALNALITAVNWEDAFIKMAYLRSRSEIPASGGVSHYHDAPDAILVLLTPDDHQFTGVEWIFYDVDQFNLPINIEIDPVGRVEVGLRVVLSLTGASQDIDIRAERAAYRLIRRDSGDESVLDDIGSPFERVIPRSALQ
jgi:hypothetical protein